MYSVFIDSKDIYFYHCPLACISLPVLCTEEIVSAVKMQVYRVSVQNSRTVTSQLSDGKALHFGKKIAENYMAFQKPNPTKVKQ